MCIYICLLSIVFGAGCFATVRSRALTHMLDATLLSVHLHLRACWMLRCCTFTYTCAHAGCYAAVRSLTLAPMLDAMLLYVQLQLRTAHAGQCWMLRSVHSFAVADSSMTLQKGQLNPALYEIAGHGDIPAFRRTWKNRRCFA